MRNSKTHSVTMKKKLTKCQTVFNAYNDLQYAYGTKLDNNQDRHYKKFDVFCQRISPPHSHPRQLVNQNRVRTYQTRC